MMISKFQNPNIFQSFPILLGLHLPAPKKISLGPRKTPSSQKRNVCAKQLQLPSHLDGLQKPRIAGFSSCIGRAGKFKDTAENGDFFGFWVHVGKICWRMNPDEPWRFKLQMIMNLPFEIMVVMAVGSFRG